MMKTTRHFMLSILMLAVTPGVSAAGESARFAPRGMLFAQPNASAPPIVRAGDDRVPDQYIVVFQDDVLPEQVPEAASEIATAHGASVRKIWSHVVKGIFAVMSEQQAEAVRFNPLVKYVEENAQWYLSAATHQTYIDPRVCDPVPPTSGDCTAVVDDRLWHLDRADQNYASPNNSYSYCTDGTGVTVYVVDTGVNKFHNEFAPGSRVQPGFNASGDFMPADDPCMGFALAPTSPYTSVEQYHYGQEVFSNGHGTSVASALGGRRVGIAKNVTIVPVKTARCDWYSSRYRISNHRYEQNETMFRLDSFGNTVIYRARNGGWTDVTDPGNWPTTAPGSKDDGTVTWDVVPTADWQNRQTTQMIIDGLEWILSAGNPGPKSNAVVTLSTFLMAGEPGVAGPTGTVEAAIRSLLASNLTVIASANNQNGNACDTSPARLSINNPNPPAPASANNVITVGGSMIVNRPWPVNISDVPGGVVADGGGTKGVEPLYDQTKAVRDARWICGAGDSNQCLNTTANCPGWDDLDKCTADPAGIIFYKGFNAGSNAGPCVTLFAPAKNLFLAIPKAADGYRDARLRNEQASGTSWSAPIVAGFAARILQGNPTYGPVDVRSALLANSVSTLETATLNTYNYSTKLQITGTPNKFLRLGDVNITDQPDSTPAAVTGPTPLSVTASGTSLPLSYRWYEVNSDFDYATYKYGAYSSAPIADATSSTFNAPSSSTRRAYWVRVTNSCGSADSDIAVVVPRPGSPSNVSAAANSASVTVTWSAGSGAEKYLIQRKVAGQPWTEAGQVNAPTLSFTETPPVPGGMVVYRVLSAAGVAYLLPENLATSSPSNNDFANVNYDTYEVITAQATAIKAQHVIELRQAVNALCDAVGAPAEYQSSDLQLSALQGKVVEDEDLTSLMTKINNIRTNPLVGASAASFTETPAANLPIKREHLQNLRDALR